MAGDGVSARLRQAIIHNDLALVERILRFNASLLYNAISSTKADTSLHLAASLGFVDIVQHLITLGHDRASSSVDDRYRDINASNGISVNTDGHTPLHLASANLHTPVVEILCENFPTTINRKDKEGRTPLLLAAGASPKYSPGLISKPTVRTDEDVSTISTLLGFGADVTAKDLRGNTCLHNACAFGNLKAIRALMESGADPLSMNFEGWRPELYSLTVQAEVYYRNLVNEISKRKAEEHQAILDSRKGKGGGAVRLVAQDDGDDSDSTDSPTGRSRADSGRSRSTFESAMS